jgi:hypothetical protein
MGKHGGPAVTYAVRAFCILFAVFLVLHRPPSADCSKGSREAVEGLSLIVPESLLADHGVSHTVRDVTGLLAASFRSYEVSVNDESAKVKLLIRAPAPAKGGSPGGEKSHHGYRWRGKKGGGVNRLELTAGSSEAVSHGLYGLLQEKLGFMFVHPRQTIVPRHERWPLPETFSWEAEPRFGRRGFHLHTLHPVELTEPLHDPSFPGGRDMLREYVDWLARNGQNLLQFYLLRGIERGPWIDHMKWFVGYAESRGIKVGVEISLFHLQQRAFRSIRLFPPDFGRQVDRNLAWLLQVPWDFVTVDFSLAEHLPDLGRLLPATSARLAEGVKRKEGTKLMFPSHVIRRERPPFGHTAAEKSPEYEALLEETGILIHTVMCYSLAEERAPVYGNENQHHMLVKAFLEASRRETWYWPESSYWVSFDSSVPLLLLPYLDARHEDMETAERIGLAGHITFTSGWEWGYWLVDWSIARWSWTQSSGGIEERTDPTSFVDELAAGQDSARLWKEALALQNEYLKERGLVTLLAALDPSAELPPPFDAPFQPRPRFGLRWLLSDATEEEAGRVATEEIRLLEEYAGAMGKITGQLEELYGGSKEDEERSSARSLANEIITALNVTSLRARHRALTLRALIAQRVKPRFWQRTTPEAMGYLARATAVRLRALEEVRRQERLYRYPAELLAGRYRGATSYDFGYLYPVRDLFFWEREEKQVKKKRLDAYYSKLWNFSKTSGIGELLCE